MIAVVQRVAAAEVRVDGETVGSAGQGLCVLVGVAEGDTAEDAAAIAAKLPDLRVFSDDGSHMNLSLNDIGGDLLLVPNFTLCADCRRGRRPDCTNAAKPAEANALFESLLDTMREKVRGNVASGVFGADMALTLTNDGPLTLVLDSHILRGPKHH